MEDEDVLLSDDAIPIGTAPRKCIIYGTSTPSHLACTCYLFDVAGYVLITRRALNKRIWPGVWANAVRGDPRHREDVPAAVRRRGVEELGVEVGLHLVLSNLRYHSTDPSGTVENECCPVLTALVSRAEVTPEPDEVMADQWIQWADLVHTAGRSPWGLSTWSVLEIGLLARDGGELPGHLRPL